jgi:hypothetical protein
LISNNPKYESYGQRSCDRGTTHSRVSQGTITTTHLRHPPPRHRHNITTPIQVDLMEVMRHEGMVVYHRTRHIHEGRFGLASETMVTLLMSPNSGYKCSRCKKCKFVHVSSPGVHLH